MTTTRIWGLAVREKGAGNILASSVSYREKYDSNDVLALILRAVNPPPRKVLSFQHPEYRYAPNAAYPAELEEFRRNTWRELAWDGDRCHLSLADKSRVEEVIGCNIKFEKIGEPVSREGIEGLFAKLAREFQILPTGTGSQPRDPSRRDPEVAAKQLELYAHHVEEIWDVLCRNMNCEPATECGGANPLQFLQEMKKRGNAFVSPLGELGPNNLHKLLPCYSANLTRRRGSHGVLRVHRFGASYSSPELALNKILGYASNRQVKIYVEADARYAFVVPDACPDMCLPVMVVDKDLREFPHPLLWRQLAEAATANAVKQGKAARPSVMLGVLGALGEAAQIKEPGAAAHLAHISGFMSNFGAGSLSYVMTPEERHNLLVGTQNLMTESGGAEGESEVKDPLNTGERNGGGAPVVTSVPTPASVARPPKPASDPF